MAWKWQQLKEVEAPFLRPPFSFGPT